MYREVDPRAFETILNHCAYALSDGSIHKGQPTSWKHYPQSVAPTFEEIALLRATLLAAFNASLRPAELTFETLLDYVQGHVTQCDLAIAWATSRDTVRRRINVVFKQMSVFLMDPLLPTIQLLGLDATNLLDSGITCFTLKPWTGEQVPLGKFKTFAVSKKSCERRFNKLPSLADAILYCYHQKSWFFEKESFHLGSWKKSGADDQHGSHFFDVTEFINDEVTAVAQGQREDQFVITNMWNGNEITLKRQDNERRAA